MSRIRSQIGTAAVLLLAPLMLIGCGGGDADDAATGGGAAETQAAAQVENPATIAGTVTFAGTPPPPEPIDMSEEPVCAEKHDGQPMKVPIVANNGQLANVFVYVKEGLSGSHPAPQEPKVLDQNGCEYIPHVMGVQTNQNITIKNSDDLLHNVNASPSENRGFNMSQPTTMEGTRSFTQPEVMIPVRCDVHGWMEAYIGVVDHPYYAVTGEDGSFHIENLPPGDYVLEAWHETLGTKTMNVTVGPNETGTANFAYEAQAAINAVVPLGEPLVLHGHAQEHAHGGE